MQITTFRAAAAALILAGTGALSQAAPSFRSPFKKALTAVQEADKEDLPGTYQWMLPSVIQAGLVQKDASIFIGEEGMKFEGRSFQLTQSQATVGVTDWLQLLYGEQNVLGIGHSSTNRLDVSDNYYSVRAVVKRPTNADPSAVSLQFEAIRPGTATISTSGGSATYAGTHNNVFSGNYLDRRENQFQLQYIDVSAQQGYAHVIAAGYGRDFALDKYLHARLQANLVGEEFEGAGQSVQNEVRPVFYACLGFNPYPWLSLEADGTLLPAGLPIAGGEFTGLSSFAVYNPGGIVNDLRTGFIGYASIRLLFHGKF